MAIITLNDGDLASVAPLNANFSELNNNLVNINTSLSSLNAQEENHYNNITGNDGLIAQAETRINTTIKEKINTALGRDIIRDFTVTRMWHGTNNMDYTKDWLYELDNELIKYDSNGNAWLMFGTNDQTVSKQSNQIYYTKDYYSYSSEKFIEANTNNYSAGDIIIENSGFTPSQVGNIAYNTRPATGFLRVIYVKSVEDNQVTYYKFAPYSRIVEQGGYFKIATNMNTSGFTSSTKTIEFPESFNSNKYRFDYESYGYGEDSSITINGVTYSNNLAPNAITVGKKYDDSIALSFGKASPRTIDLYWKATFYRR